MIYAAVGTFARAEGRRTTRGKQDPNPIESSPGQYA